jgi:hypothetical protein
MDIRWIGKFSVLNILSYQIDNLDNLGYIFSVCCNQTSKNCAILGNDVEFVKIINLSELKMTICSVTNLMLHALKSFSF